MLNLFVVLWTVLAIALTAVAVGFIPNRPVGLSVGALVWALYRMVIVNVHWAFVRPLDIGWVVIVGLLTLGVMALNAFHRAQWAPWLSRIAMGIAVLAPFLDMFGEPFWGDWVHEHILVIAAMILVLFAIGGALINGSTIKAVKAAGYIIVILGVLMLAAWVKYGLTGNAGPNTSPTATATTSASPAPPASTSSTATPAAPATSAAPLPSSTTTPASPTSSTPTATAGKVYGWDDVLNATESAHATAEWQALVNSNQPKLGWWWSDAKTWATTKMPDGNIAGARMVVVFDAPASEIDDPHARELAGVAGTELLVTRATGCYATLPSGQVCPSGAERAVLFIAPIGTEADGTLNLKSGSGIALTPTDGGKVVLTPATYPVVS